MSSVATRRCRNDSRISCCSASLRENTVTLAGRPASPSSSRRTSACPRDPVPPVTTTRLSLSIGSLLLGQLLDHLLPGGRIPVEGFAQAGCVEAAVDPDARLRLDLGVEAEAVADQLEQGELRNRLGADMPDAVELTAALDEVADQPAKHGRRRPAEDGVGVALHAAAGGQEPFEQAAVALELAPEHRCPERQDP